MPQRDPIAETMQAAVEHGVFPGAVLMVRHRSRLFYHQAFGHSAIYPERQFATVDTIYDLASLTKPLATTTALLCLVQDGQVRLEDAVEAIFPDLKGSAVGRATIFHLLNHSSGLPGWRPFYELIAERDREQPGFLGTDAARRLVLDEIRHETLDYPIGTRSLYSDLGFILLGMIVERLTGVSLARFCQERVYEAVGAHPLYFISGRGGAAPESFGDTGQKNLVAPTETDPWRGRVLRAEVHDENAYALGGIAGHAGLFGTAAGVGGITALWVDCYLGRRAFLSPDLVRRFVSRQATPESSWGLGWDTPSVPSSSGRHFSSQSFGHLGFTGTSIWIDPALELEVILLSNRVHTTRENTGIQRIRPIVHDLIYEQVVGEKSCDSDPGYE